MRSGFIGIIGRANAGKSTLVNVLVGEKVAIVSPKPQTTRNSIMGILTKEDYQLVFVDTPGIYKSGNYLTDLMLKSTDDAAKDVDFILFVHDGHGGVSDEDIQLIKKYYSGHIPMAIAYTKIDIMPKERCSTKRISAVSFVNIPAKNFGKIMMRIVAAAEKRKQLVIMLRYNFFTLSKLPAPKL